MRNIRHVRKIPIADKQLLAELKQIVLQRLPGATLILYGSAARGMREPDSDFDVLILVDAPLSREEEEAIDCAVYSLELDREVVLSTFTYTRDEWNDRFRSVTPFHRNVEKEGVLL